MTDTNKILGFIQTKNGFISYICGNFDYVHIGDIREALSFDENNKKPTKDDKTFSVSFNEDTNDISLTFFSGKLLSKEEALKFYKNKEIKPENNYTLSYFYEDVINAISETGENYFTTDSIEEIISKIDLDDIQDIAMSCREYPEQVSTLNALFGQNVKKFAKRISAE